ncbi:MAG: hypothetical protein ETSY1_15325 [Candidatus Entotheonella factor]|uniref:HBL/NHE enterotoxin family protein n=1 Tax=Entotheonella factor TaxID=1429438 RepID=W4LPM0_ENTF1|nr:HBL/NHE enterotoxin family protein [Candidatus Entotheonella palauensis]ETW99356.1 MAG: hypothetical protein ETSY1_15325 [Candidatus Entotheonella factor]
MANPSNTVPTDDIQQALAGAFLAIQSANKAIATQSKMPPVNITGLEDVNTSLATAQAHAAHYTKNISANIQNQLQAIIDYDRLYDALVVSIDSLITEIGQGTKANPPSDATMNNLAAELAALQSQVQTNLYGAGGTADLPLEASALGVYNQLVDYQAQVGTDASTFKGYSDLAYNSESGVSAHIKQLNQDIEADRDAMAKDRAMIGGGAAMIVTGALIVVVAVALAPETGGASAVVIGTVGVAVAGGGTAMIVAGSTDLDKKEQEVSNKLIEIANDQTELANLTAINTSSGNVAQHASDIFGALDTIKNNWAQMDNNMADTISALNLPQDQLMNWIANKSGNSNPDYSTMATILNAELVAPKADWEKAKTTAQTILNAFDSVAEYNLPDGTVPTQDTIAAHAAAA